MHVKNGIIGANESGARNIEKDGHNGSSVVISKIYGAKRAAENNAAEKEEGSLLSNPLTYYC